MLKCRMKGDLHLVLALVWAFPVLQAAVVLVVMPIVRFVLAVLRLVNAKDVLVRAVVVLVMPIILCSTSACQ